MKINRTIVLLTLLQCFIGSTFAQGNLRDARPEDIDVKAPGTEPAESGKGNAAGLFGVAGVSQRVQSYKAEGDGVWVRTTGGMLRLQPLGDGIVRVSYGTRQAIDGLQSFAVDSAYAAKAHDSFKIRKGKRSIDFSTASYTIRLDRALGSLSLLDAEGNVLVGEAEGKARLNAVGDSVCPYAKFRLKTADEGLYGLGQFRDGRLSLRNCQRELIQFNTQAAVPVVYSTAGWGLFWNNTSRTLFSDDAGGMTFVSDYGKAVDYYLFVGKDIDGLIARYRTLTGHVPMLPKWALGFHQSRNRYHNRGELMQIADRMKKEGIPMSSLFIDYHYWGRYGTGSMRFDESLWPNLSSMIDSLHNVYDTRVVITQWPCFKPGTPNYERMSKQGFILEGARAIDGYVYDVFNPAARKEYRNLIQDLLRQGIDGWFLDGPEPDHMPTFITTQTAMGPALRVRNLYPLLHIANFHEALSKVVTDKRPYLLTRCAWAGQQRYGSAVWSGDIPTNFNELRLQVAAGLDFTAAGLPYWTTDIGGYLKGDPYSQEYREVFTRWFQYGTFCPIFRSHGRREPFDTSGPNELWAYGDTVQRICTDLVLMRYKLMPYIYSLTRMVSNEDYTPMRLLAFDFADDKAVRDIRDQFMYGPAFLVCPVIKAGARSRSVYLPKSARWFDYHTGKVLDGGQTITADAPLERMPLYVKAGSIVPLAGDTIDIWPGADADFTLYEDDGETWKFEDGDYRVTRFHWDNARARLTISCSDGKGESVKDGRNFVVRWRGENIITGKTNGRDTINMYEFSPSRMEYFSWINNTNEGSTEAQTMANLDFFRWMKDKHGMQLDIYAFDSGQIDGARFYGSMDSERFRTKFPDSFDRIHAKAAGMGTRLGLWGGPDGFGNTPDEAAKRTQTLVSLARDYNWGLFKFDAVCGALRPEHSKDFTDMMAQVRHHSPDLILLNHRLGLDEAEAYATTFLWEGQESYVDVNIFNRQTAPHHRVGGMARGLVPGMKRLTEDHGVCLSSCLDGWDDELVLHAFGRNLVLAPELYGNPWLLRDDEFPRLARLCNIHREYGQLLVDGLRLPAGKYGDFAVSRGDGETRFVVLRNLSWEDKPVDIVLGEEIGLQPADSVWVTEFHPSEKQAGQRAFGEKYTVVLQPFRAALLKVSSTNGGSFVPSTSTSAVVRLGDLSQCDVPADANALYEATVFAADNNALEVRSLQRSGATTIPEVKAARDAFFGQQAFVNRGCWDRNLFDGDLTTGLFPSKRRGDQRIGGGCLRLDLGKVCRVDSIRLHVGSYYGLDPMMTEEGQQCSVSTDLEHWKTIGFVSDTLMTIALGGDMRYLRLPGAPGQLCEIEVFGEGGRKLDSGSFRASNLFSPSRKWTKAWKATVTLPEHFENGKVCVAVEGVHGVEGAYATMVVDGKRVGAADRAPSYPSNVWENGVIRADRSYTYYFPVSETAKGREATVYVLSCDEAHQDLKPVVYFHSKSL